MTGNAGVSARTDTALREAMGRLFAGRPRCTDGRLIKHNLAKEAGVSEATMFRAKVVLAEWDQHIAGYGALDPGRAHDDADLQEARRRLTEAKREITELQQQLVAAATVIAALHHDNQLLRLEQPAHGTSAALPQPASGLLRPAPPA